jgi:thioredoxin 1
LADAPRRALFVIQEHQRHGFREVLSSSEPTIVFFWAPYSQLCKRFIPAIEDFALERKGDAKLVSINCEEYLKSAKAAKLDSIPALQLYHRGQLVHEIVGTCKKDKVIEMWDRAKAARSV